MNAILISGSRNPKGQTARALDAVAGGLRQQNVETETLFLPALRIERCRQFDDNGWGLCRQEGRCVIEDDFPVVVYKLRRADRAVFSTPVYFAELSESLRALLDRLRRICTHKSGRSGIADKPALGICVAGGGGGGATACCSSLEKALSGCGFAVADTVPVRRQNLETKLPHLADLGKWLAGEMK